jgi:hypothetical protein
MEYYHDQHIGVYKNAVPSEWCNKVIDYFNSNPNNFNSRNHSNIADTHGHLWDKLLIEELNKKIRDVLHLYKNKYPDFITPLEIVGYKIQKTLPTEGYHPFHIEFDTKFITIKRIGVWTVYLNDVEEGGETEFLYQLKRIKPQKGTICIFPAGYTHTHRGNTPFSGEKYIMTGWLDMILPDNVKIIEDKLRK